MSKLLKEISKLENVEISTNQVHADWIKESYLTADSGNHPNTRTAALLVKEGKIILRGINTFPPKVKELKKRLEGDNRHIFLNHAEQDVLYKAARTGTKTKGLTLVVPLHPCILCANAIISCKISTIVLHQQKVERTRKGWFKDMVSAAEVMSEAGVRVILYNGEVGMNSFLHGEIWQA